ncbi:CHRD domain-containing protein [Alteromonas halophila]|uniref:CHRD domain-containing protein n=1 Tax=Alteromonas halophila TaxID=516698 RepID=A0A918JPT3_9ALTE|nr:CHRD domain-containing protein [Alteromonas halophila]GGW95629.1 hypothetical protein GCM10007391_32220 [Alteromonas halophila]
MRRNKLLLSAFVTPVLLTGCWLDDDDDTSTPSPDPVPPADPEYANVRVIHAASDAPTVDITANDDILNGLEMVDYQMSSGRFEVETGEYDVGVTANLPGDDAEVLQADVVLEADMNYDFFAVGNVGDDSLMLLPVSSTETAVDAGNAQVQIVHAASMAPTVDIYVTAPDADLSSQQPLVTAAFTDATDLQQITAGDYRIRITPAGETDVVYDSGTVNLADGADLLIAATNNVATGDSPVTLLVADGTEAMKLYDMDATADIRVVHGISDGPAVDVIANNEITLVDGLSFPSATDYLNVMPGDYLIDIVADEDNSIVAVDDAEVTLEQGMFYTAVANNTLASPELDLLTDMPRSIATEAQVRVVHASPAAGAVDVYVTGDGDIDGVDPALSNIQYSTGDLADSGYVSLAEGEYVITVTPTGTKTAAIETGMLTLDNGGIYTAVAVNGDMEGDLPQLILQDDLAPPAPAFEADMTYSVSLSGHQEVPAVDVMTMAAAMVEIDEDLPAFRITLDASMVENANAAHVHDGDIGMNGDVAFPLTASGDGEFVLEQTMLTPELLEDLTSGEWYLNVHTDAYPSGEVRGQIVADTTAVVTFPISGAQSVLATDSMAMGYGYALYDTTSDSVMLTAVTEGIDDATAAHIHTGYAGETGGVVVGLMQHSEMDGVWMTDGAIALDGEVATRLLSGGHYTNFHTPAFPNGEIRGQITPDNIEVYGITATGDQEVPAVTTSAYGYGAFTLNTDTGALRGQVSVFDITPNMAHLHEGEAGSNGGVVFGLESNGMGMWFVPDNTMLTDGQIETMQAAGYYTNFHTDAFPDGELRGQVTLGFDQ